ncbi:MAG: aldo/keto reductase, partial [Frankiales bacterium]|nr:aldo/keto reductase [Frankiales bacterium]
PGMRTSASSQGDSRTSRSGNDRPCSRSCCADTKVRPPPAESPSAQCDVCGQRFLEKAEENRIDAGHAHDDLAAVAVSAEQGARDGHDTHFRRQPRPLSEHELPPIGPQRRRATAALLGFWKNFGGDRPMETQGAIMRRAFDLGITHFDLANNNGPTYGAAEANVGRLLAEDFRRHRDELITNTKVGWDMWLGPYGDRGSRMYLLASLDQSLRRWQSEPITGSGEQHQQQRREEG